MLEAGYLYKGKFILVQGLEASSGGVPPAGRVLVWHRTWPVTGVHVYVSVSPSPYKIPGRNPSCGLHSDNLAQSLPKGPTSEHNHWIKSPPS